MSGARRELVFGASDGVTIALGLVVSLAAQPAAMLHAALGAGLAELVGMTAGRWLSDDTHAGLPLALCNGAAAFGACLLPAVPLSVAHGPVPLAASLAITCAVAAVISWLRPEKGLLAVVQTYGILAVAAALCLLAGML